MYTFCSIKYMNRSSFFEDQVYDWGRFQNTCPHTRTKITLKLHPQGDISFWYHTSDDMNLHALLFSLYIECSILVHILRIRD